MALTTEQIQEIKTYMDERGELWRLKAEDAAHAAMREEVDRQDQKRTRRLQFLSAIGGVSLAAVFGLAYNAINNYAEVVAERTATAKVDEVLGEDNRVIGFLEKSMGAVVAAQTAAGVAQQGSENALAEAEQILEQAQRTNDQLEAQLTEVQATLGEVTDSLSVINDTSARLSAESRTADELLAETRAKRAELNRLTQDTEKVKALADQLLGSGSAIEEIVLAALQSADIRQQIVSAAAFPAGAVVAFDGTNCPVGWAAHAPAEGRFLFGAGGDVSAGETGGASSVEVARSIQAKTSTAEFVSAGAIIGIKKRRIKYLSAVGDRPASIAITPPYLALTLCRKD